MFFFLFHFQEIDQSLSVPTMHININKDKRDTSSKETINKYANLKKMQKWYKSSVIYEPSSASYRISYDKIYLFISTLQMITSNTYMNGIIAMYSID
jgi:hypothetical protein